MKWDRDTVLLLALAVAFFFWSIILAIAAIRYGMKR
jgi:hypothetical protein